MNFENWSIFGTDNYKSLLVFLVSQNIYNYQYLVDDVTLFVRLSTGGSTQQVSGFATAEQFEAAFGQQTSDFNREPAAGDGNSFFLLRQ